MDYSLLHRCTVLPGPHIDTPQEMFPVESSMAFYSEPENIQQISLTKGQAVPIEVLWIPLLVLL